MNLLPDRVIEAALHTHDHTETHSPAAVADEAPTFTIVMSREAGSRGAQIAHVVGAQLGWPVYDQELLNKIAAEKGLHARMLEHLDERSVNWLEECASMFCAGQPVHAMSYLRLLLEQFATLGKRGRCVIVGRGAAHVLPPERTLRIRVVAPRAERIAEAGRRFGYSPQEAEKWVDRTDRERARFVKECFHKVVTDPMCYDLTLNSGRFADEACATLIIAALHELEARVRTKPHSKAMV